LLIVDNQSDYIVLAIPIEFSSDSLSDSLLDFLAVQALNIPKPGNEITIPSSFFVDTVVSTLTGNSPKYVYYGSLTTPPCTEGVRFLVPTKNFSPIKASSFNNFKLIMKFNARFIQNTPGTPNALDFISNCPSKCEGSKEQNKLNFQD
jgi:carbonic anhydrase